MLDLPAVAETLPVCCCWCVFVQAGGGSSGLEELYFDECTAVTDTGLAAVSASCRGLKVLSVRRCTRLTDSSLIAVAERGTLETLSVNGVHQVTSALINSLTTCCKDTLHDLDISFCRDVSESALGKMVDHCVNLRRLRVYGCSQLTKRFLYGHGNERLTEIMGATLA